MTQTIEQLTDALHQAASESECPNQSIEAKAAIAIEQLTARVRELEEENKELRREKHCIRKHTDEVVESLHRSARESQAYAEQLRESMFSLLHWLRTNHYNSIADNLAESITLPRDTSALDAFVAEKVKEAKAEVLDQVRNFKRVREQRDLAVEALNAMVSVFGHIDASYKALSVIKESEGK
jgi:FtsZ-binding cell division protein ZapB